MPPSLQELPDLVQQRLLGLHQAGKLLEDKGRVALGGGVLLGPGQVGHLHGPIQGQLKLYEDDNAEALLGGLLSRLEKEEG